MFEMDLPDAVTGACPAGGVPVYRIWNQRYDSNHRYTTSTAIRDQMVAEGRCGGGLRSQRRGAVRRCPSE